MAVKIIVGYLKFLNRLLQQQQIDLSQSEIDPIILDKFKQALISQSSDLIAVNDYLVLMHFTQQFVQRPIALMLAESASLQDLGLVGYLASTSWDLKQALQLFEQYYSLLYQQTNQEELSIQHQKDHIVLQWPAPYITWQSFYELNLALIFKMTDSIVEHGLTPPNDIKLGYQTYFPIYHYEKFFGCKVVYQAQCYGIRFPIQNLNIKNFAADSALNEVLSLQAKHALNAESRQPVYTQQLKYKVKILISQGFLVQQQLQSYVAKQLYCSERTLQRQLKKEGWNFQQILDEYRYEQAILYLRQGKNLSEISDLLNYADQSAFGRAFKRWSGHTPKSYLEHNRI